MNWDVAKSKTDFVEEVFFSNAFSAAVQHSKTYSEGVVQKDKDRIRATLKQLLRDIRKSVPYVTGGVRDDEHVRTIEKIARQVTDSYPEHLHNYEFRIGTAQKVLNVYLKLYWCIGEIAEPPHCPLDSVIIGALDPEHQSISWTTLTKLSEYEELINAVKRKASAEDGENLSAAVWELKNYPELSKPRKTG